MHGMYLAEVALAVEQEAVRHVVEKVVYHQDGENMQYDFPRGLHIKGGDKRHDGDKKHYVGGQGNHLAGFDALGVHALGFVFLAVLFLVVIVAFAKSRDLEEQEAGNGDDGDCCYQNCKTCLPVISEIQHLGTPLLKVIDDNGAIIDQISQLVNIG